MCNEQNLVLAFAEHIFNRSDPLSRLCFNRQAFQLVQVEYVFLQGCEITFGNGDVTPYQRLRLTDAVNPLKLGDIEIAEESNRLDLVFLWSSFEANI